MGHGPTQTGWTICHGEKSRRAVLNVEGSGKMELPCALGIITTVQMSLRASEAACDGGLCSHVRPKSVAPLLVEVDKAVPCS